MTARNA